MDRLSKIHNKAADLISEVLDLGYSAGFNAAVREKEKDSLKAAYQMGLEDCWYAVQKLFSLKSNDLDKIFGEGTDVSEVIMNYPVRQIIERLDNYLCEVNINAGRDDTSGVD